MATIHTLGGHVFTVEYEEAAKVLAEWKKAESSLISLELYSAGHLTLVAAHITAIHM